MTIAEKYIRQYNQFNGKKISRNQLSDFHSRLKKDIDAKKIDAHVRYGVELLAIEQRIAKVLPRAAVRVRVILDKPVKIKKARNIIITQTAQGPEVVKAKNKAIHYHHEDITFFYGLPCNPPEADQDQGGLGFTREGQQKIYDMVTNMILDAMKKEKLFWRKTWDGTKSPNPIGVFARNFKSNKPYRGANYWMTNFVAPSLGKTSPYFLTFKQVKDLGGTVKKGSKSFPIVYYNFFYIVTVPTRKNISEEQYRSYTKQQRDELGAKKLPMIMYYSVFNALDIEGIDFPSIDTVAVVKSEKEKIESCEAIVSGMPKRPDIRHGGDRAFYTTSDDHVQMPVIDSFEKEQEYYGTLFHELVHSTGHQSRIGRKFGRVFGDKDYAYEELTAELGASYLCAEGGILYFTMKNSAAYLQSWQKNLEEIMQGDNKFFLNAAAQAQRASDFILGISEEGEKSEEKTDKSREPIKREAPAAKKVRHPKLNGIVDATQLGALQFSKIDLDGPYKQDFLKIYSDTQLMIWGSPGSGKTVYTLKFAQYLAEHKGLNVLYVANEELGRSTFTEKIQEFKIGHANLKFVKSLKDVESAGFTVDDFDVVFFDSVNSMGLTLEDYRKFSDENPGIIKVLVVQSTKDGDFRGGKDWEHEVDIAGEVKNRKMVLRKNRLDQSFAEKSDELMFEEAVNDQKRKKLIREKVQVETKKDSQ
jgi:antirestriction protein ArdC